VAVWPIDNALRQVDLSVDGTEMVTVAGEAAAAQLLSAQVAAAWLDDTAARLLAGQEGFSLVATPPMVESLGGVVVARRLVDPARDRDVGLALVRALIRTINTHLAGDSGRYVHDWELRSGTTERMQGSFVWLGSVRYDRVIPESRLVDRSLYEEVVDRDQDQG
jgi:NitT/TauT family transport system substrate-binding protein